MEMMHAESRALMESLGSVMPSGSAQQRTSGTVTRVEADGTVWVRVAGATSETPCTQTSVAAKVGDRVSLTVQDGRATVEGNFTSPATDDALAGDALRAGSSAQQTADMAHQRALDAIIDAENARDAAKSAYSSAIGALTSFGTVQDVLGTLDDISKRPVFVQCPPGEVIVEGVSYYILTDAGYELVEDPVAEDIEDYYVVDASRMLTDFLDSHLTLTNKGLYITTSKPVVNDDGTISYDPGEDPTGYILLGSDGIKLFDGTGREVATYGDETKLGVAGEDTKTIVASDELALYRKEGAGSVSVFGTGTSAHGHKRGTHSFLRFGELPHMPLHECMGYGSEEEMWLGLMGCASAEEACELYGTETWDEAVQAFRKAEGIEGDEGIFEFGGNLADDLHGQFNLIEAYVGDGSSPDEVHIGSKLGYSEARASANVRINGNTYINGKPLSLPLPLNMGGTGKTNADDINSVLFAEHETLGGVFGYTSGWTGGYATLKELRNQMGLGNTTGALPVANGGTGITSNPSLLVNLASTSAASVFQASPRPGITGTLAVAHGGTGATSYSAARNTLWFVGTASSGYGVTNLVVATTKAYVEFTSRTQGVFGATIFASDARMKSDIRDSEVTALDAVNAIKHRAFAMNGHDHALGYVAQELGEIDPDLVLMVPQSKEVGEQFFFTGDYRHQVDETTLLPYLSKAIQELSAKVDALTEEVERLKGDAA